MRRRAGADGVGRARPARKVRRGVVVMPKYIDTDKLNLYDDLFMKGKNDSGVWVRYRDVENLIKNAPAADVQEVRRGEWIIENAGDGWKRAICPHCLKVFLYAKGHYQIGIAPYCPECGTIMDGGEDNA